MSNLVKTGFVCMLIGVWGAGCVTSRVVGSTKTAEVTVESTGIIWVGERQVKMGKIGKSLKSQGFDRDREVKVLIADTHDRALMQAISADLVMSGFKRPIFITEKKTESNLKKRGRN